MTKLSGEGERRRARFVSSPGEERERCRRLSECRRRSFDSRRFSSSSSAERGFGLRGYIEGVRDCLDCPTASWLSSHPLSSYFGNHTKSWRSTNRAFLVIQRLFLTKSRVEINIFTHSEAPGSDLTVWGIRTHGHALLALVGWLSAVVAAARAIETGAEVGLAVLLSLLRPFLFPHLFFLGTGVSGLRRNLSVEVISEYRPTREKAPKFGDEI